MQNLDLKNKADNAKKTKEYIEQILNQLLSDYQKTKKERHQIALWEESQDFTVLGVIEVFTSDIRGYAFQVVANDSLENNQEVVENLRKLKIFEIPYFAQWYFSTESDYPQIKRYIETLNYLRLLIIEYIGER
ncbi:MAG: hypothetical protein RMZ41_007155 [Nostoc sp. DedVER02]|uniref:hypothetical protein n=1 Tax=unclassified Nostoc TaxID=2593658 RepID=UPI002AD52F85|nr:MULTISPECIES: hypothetical protein [unclassified Nostoc]MDZ7985516.1 hypothetical protein [Nostoc sp. DedVER02]MDZ8116982.1 hypothetical protein [Nostoc sp. DedVER01b]MEA5602726.1 hypothetical protein [Nostoc sp. UHCC 0252]